MAKKQTRRSISVSRTTYERLKAFCEINNISMSQLVETRVNDFLSVGDVPGGLPAIPSRAATGTVTGAVSAPVTPPSVSRPVAPRPALLPAAPSRAIESRPQPAPVSVTGSATASQPPMTSAAARFAVDPPPPIIKPRQDTVVPKPAEKRPEQIFTF